MKDNQLIKLIFDVLEGQQAISGIPDIEFAQAYQPTQQGVNSVSTAYLFKVGDVRIGLPLCEDKWDTDTQIMVHTETQVYQTTFQLSALSIQDPTIGEAQLTASDIVNACAYIMQSQATVEQLIAADVGILNVKEIRNPYFVDDHENFEANPSFDFTLTHKQIVISNGRVLQSTEFQVLTV